MYTDTHTHRHTQDTRQKKWLHRTRTSRSHEPLTTMSPRPSMHQTPSWCPRSVHSRCSQKRKGRGAWTKASIQMYTHTQTQTGTDRQTDRQTQTKTQIHTDRHRQTDRQTDTDEDTDTHRQAQTHSLSHTHRGQWQQCCTSSVFMSQTVRLHLLSPDTSRVSSRMSKHVTL